MGADMTTRTPFRAAAWLAFALLLWMALAFTPQAKAETPGWVQARSQHDVATTLQRLQQAVTAADLQVFAHINHSAAAAKAGLQLRPTELLIFGNPKAGTLLMQCSQTTGIDLPLKMLVWQDAQGHTWIGYTDPQAIARRHDADNCPIVPKMSALMHKLMEQSAG
jgi:uncharacterized protein (DUF302 family)